MARYLVALDAYRLVGPPTSVGTYTEELLESLLEEDCEVVLLAPHDEPDSLLDRIQKRLPAIRTIKPTFPEKPYDDWYGLLRWNQWVIPKLLEELPADVLISTYHQVPTRVPRNVARLAIIHDCCGLRVDCGYRKYGRAWWRHWSNLKSSAVFADVIVPISKTTYDDYLRLNPGSRNRLVSPVYNRVSRPVLDPESVRTNIEALNLASSGYVLGFALAGKRKGTDVALRAYSEYRRNGGSLPLVLMGGGSLNLTQWGLSAEFETSVIAVGRVDDDLRDALYAHAACFLFFSRCEGFGYPIIEAARQGCPIIAWNHGTAPELLGDSQTLMSELTASEGALMIAKFAGLDGLARFELRERLIAQSLQFAKGNTGKAFVTAIEKAVSLVSAKST